MKLNFKTILLVVFFSTITALLNLTRLPLFYDFELIIAPIIVLVLAVYRGPYFAFIVSVLSSIPLYLHWHSFLPMIVFALEALFVGFFYSQIRANLVMVIIGFWVLFGLPISWYYLGTHDIVIDSQKEVFVLKRFINSLFNAQIASLIVASKLGARFIANEKFRKLETLHRRFAQQLSVIFVSVAMVVLFLILGFEAVKTLKHQKLNQNLLHEFLLGKIEVLMLSRIASIKELAHTMSLVWDDEDARHQELVDSSARLPYFNAITLANNNAIVVDAYAANETIPDVKSTIYDISDRDYYNKAIHAQKPYVSKAFVNRGKQSYLVAAISSAIHKRGEDLGTVQGAMFLHDLTGFKELFNHYDKSLQVLLDQDNQLVYSSSNAFLKPMDIVELRIADSVVHNQKMAKISVNTVTQETDLYFFRQTEFAWGWKLLSLESEHSFAQYNRNLYFFFVLFLSVSIVLAEVVATVLGSFWTRQLRNISSEVKFIGLENKEQHKYDSQDLPQELKLLYQSIENRNREIALVKKENARLLNEKTSQFERVNKKLIALESQDFLTGLPNRQTFNTRLNELWQLRSKNQELLSMIVIDIDNFKKLNSQWGVAACDEILIQVAECLRQRQKLCDHQWLHCIARISGKEFAVISFAHSHSDTVVMAQQIQNELHEKKFVISNNNVFSMLNISTSVAVVSVDSHKYSLEEMLKLMDKSILKAQKKGGSGFYHVNKSIFV